MSCKSIDCINAEDQVNRIRSAKPEWQKLQARFIKNLCMEKEKEKERTSLRSFSFSSSSLSTASSFSSPFGSVEIDPGSPDNYICRQRYLRSYRFTREKKGVLEKSRSWLKEKKEGKGKGTKDTNKNKGKIDDFMGVCLRFLLFCVTKVDVEVPNSVDSSAISLVPTESVDGR